MKKILSMVLVCVLLVGCVFSLAGCVLSLGPLTMISGEYEADLIVSENEYEFSPLGGVTLTVDPVFGDDKEYKGKYKVNEDEKTINLTFENSDADKTYGGTFDFVSGEEDGVKYIKIGVVKYTLVD